MSLKHTNSLLLQDLRICYYPLPGIFFPQLLSGSSVLERSPLSFLQDSSLHFLHVSAQMSPQRESLSLIPHLKEHLLITLFSFPPLIFSALDTSCICGSVSVSSL